MPLFEKIIEQGKGGTKSADETLQDKIRKQKMSEMDEAAADRIAQGERTREAELAGREAEGHKKVADAQASILDRAMPQAAWTFFGELLKDRNPQSPMTVEDMLRVLDYSKSLQSGPSEQPPDGVYGVLTALITQMGQNRQQISPLELIQAMQAMNPPTQGTQGSQLSEMLTNFALMKNLSASPAPPSASEPGLLVQPTDSQGRPMGGAISMPIPALTELFKTNMEIQHSQERHQQSMGLIESLRKEFPRIISAAERQLGKGEGPAPKGRGSKQQGDQAQEPVQMPMVQCPHCSIQFGVPPGMKDVLCPSPACPSNQQRREQPEEIPPEGSRSL